MDMLPKLWRSIESAIGRRKKRQMNERYEVNFASFIKPSIHKAQRASFAQPVHVHCMHMKF